MVEPKLYFCEHLNYSISAEVAKNCYYLSKADLLCKYSGKDCVVLMSPTEIERRAESHFERTLSEVGNDLSSKAQGEQKEGTACDMGKVFRWMGTPVTGPEADKIQKIFPSEGIPIPRE